jgi:hypothetical protein
MNLLVAHMIGDYFFQNNWMALNKTKNSLICGLHCLLYTLSISIICQWFDWRLFIVFFTHFIMDRFRLATYWRKFYSKDEQIPWIITSDNSIHLLILWLLSLI